MEPDRKAVAAVVVDHRSGTVLPDCVRSLLSEGAHPIVVVDNDALGGSSRDALVAHGIDDGVNVVIMPTGANLGYGTGANRGVSAIRADLVLICNPDLVVHDGAIGVMAEVFAHDPRLAICGPYIAEADGSRYPSVRRFPSPILAVFHTILSLFAPRNGFSRKYKMDDLDPDQPAAVDWVSGAAMMVRRSAFEELGGFDESYFMYFEDVDLAYRAHGAGWTVRYEPAARVTHLQGVTTDRHPYQMLVAHHRSAMHYATKRAKGAALLGLPLVAVALGLRLIAAIAQRALRPRHRSLRPPRAE